MNTDPGKRVVILISFCIAILSFLINIIGGEDFFYSSFMALCVMFVSALILLQMGKMVIYVMMKFLQNQKDVEDDSVEEETE